MRKSYVALLLFGAVALTANLALAQEDERGGGYPKLMNARLSQEMLSRAAKLGTSFTPSPNDTVWVGYNGNPNNYWGVGRGPNRPGVNNNGMWNWDIPVHGDSLQGWWTVRYQHTNTSGAVRTDVNRAWWAIELGNGANYVINQGDGRATGSHPGVDYRRTFGVVGVWHSDPGNTGAGAGKGVGWTPLGGSQSAWMGLRRHGDLTVSDPITLNPFNEDVHRFIPMGPSASVSGTDRKYPGYGGQMDQMLYKDIDVSGAPADSGVTLYFSYNTQMSTQHGTAVRTRTGWFFGDPLGVPSVNDGNFISCEANVTLDCPVDSFEVYIGAPVDTSWIDHSGLVHSDVYDPLRRWFNEVLRKGQQRWLYAAVGNNSEVGKAVSISAAEKAALTSPEGKLRIVFRSHTNRGFDDADYGANAYSSLGRGAAQVDDIAVADGSGTSPVTIGTFESGSGDLDIDNSSATAWHSTGKPPNIYAHVHDLSTLTFEDLCGDENSPFRICDLRGGVISMGDHDNGEKAGGAPNTTESEGYWGMLSPTINLVAASKVRNDWDLTLEEATPTKDFAVWYDFYAGIFDLFTGGNFWQSSWQNYPANDGNGNPTWGFPRQTTFIYFNPDKQCFHFFDEAKPNNFVVTSNLGGLPDSVRIGFRKTQQCYRFVGATGCSPADGCYQDNASLLIMDGAPAVISVDIWHWFNDTFPVNEDGSLPGTVNFDTCAAYIRTGLCIYPTTGVSGPRFDVPGDSVNINARGDSIRVDMVFRIRPGVGNYVTVGDPTSGLRVLPTSPTAVSAGDGSFWDEYRINPGEKSAGVHPVAGWDPLTWNSARCDTLERNYWPVFRRGLINVDIAGETWATTYHELDPHYTSLGTVKNRCFVIDTTLTLDDPNVRCDGGHPAYLDDPGIAAEAAWDGTNTTIENTSMLPDGLFTPGTAFQYFIRKEEMKGPGAGEVALCPDTTLVTPQDLEGSIDGHRWQQFAVLPDRWKEPLYGGSGLPCMLYIDWNDRRGDERIFMSIADTIGANDAAAVGGHNGWGKALAGASVNSPAYRTNKNRGAGTTYDMYGVKASESANTGAASIGTRFSAIDPSPANKVHNKYSKQGPTDKMLSSYYKILLILTGDLNNAVWGPFLDRSQNDVKTLENFLLGAPDTANARGIWVAGNGIVEDNFNQGGPQEAFSNNRLDLDMLVPGYRGYSFNPAQVVDLTPSAALSPSAEIWGTRNACTYTNDVLDLSFGTLGEASPSLEYQNFGVSGPYVAGAYKPATVTNPWIALTDGFDVFTLTDRFDSNGSGKWRYYLSAFSNIFGTICNVQGTPIVGLELPGTGNGARYVNFMRNIGPNPLISGQANVGFSLAKADRVELKVYDVTGRLVRTLVNGQLFQPGEHSVIWDGVSNAGQKVARGVYFTQLRYLNSRFVDSKKVTVLK